MERSDDKASYAGQMSETLSPFVRLWNSAGIYAIANFANAAIPLLLIPVLTRYLRPVDYGIIATFQVLVALVAPFVGLSTNGAIARKYYDAEVDMAKFIGNCMIIMTASSLLVAAVLWTWSEPIGRLAAFPTDWLGAIVIVSLGQFVILALLAVMQVRDEARAYGVTKIAVSLAAAALTLWFVVGLDMAWRGSLFAQSLVGGLTVVIGLALLRKMNCLKLSFDSSHVHYALRFGVPLIPHVFGGWIMLSLDRLFINRLVGVADTGIYALAFQISLIITLIEMSFNTAWIPWLYEQLNRKEAVLNLKIVKFTYAYVGAVLILTGILALSAPSILGWAIGKDFSAASHMVVWLMVARGIEAMYYMTCNYMFYATKTWLVAVCSAVAALVHAICSFKFIQLYGAQGAAYATVISSTVLVILVWFFASRVHAMPWLLRTKSIRI